VTEEPDIRTYRSWAKAHDKKCRRFAGYEGNQRVYRITDTRTILQDAGFRLLGSTKCNRDRPFPWVAVHEMVSHWATPLSSVVYYKSIQGEIIVWGK